PPRGLVARDHRFQILRLAEEIRTVHRRLHRLCTARADMAAALRPELTDVTGKARAPVPLAAVVVDHRHAEMQLDVRHLEIGPGFEEAAAFGEIRGHRAAAL